MNEKLDGKRVLVTAGAQGIGEAISRAFLDAGAKVALHYFSSSDNAERIASEAAGRGGVAIPLPGDLRQKDPASRMVDEAANRLGGLDILINNAGSLVERKWLDEIAPTFWRKVIDIKSEFHALRVSSCRPLPGRKRREQHGQSGVAGRPQGRSSRIPGLCHQQGRNPDFHPGSGHRTGAAGHAGQRRGPRPYPRHLVPRHPHIRTIGQGNRRRYPPRPCRQSPRTWPEPSFTWLPNTTVSSPAPPSTSTEASTPRRQNTRIN